MMSALLRYFIYGFMLFAGIWLTVDMPFYVEGKKPIFGYSFTIEWGIVGGISFLVAYGSGWCLKAILFGRRNKDAD